MKFACDRAMSQRLLFIILARDEDAGAEADVDADVDAWFAIEFGFFAFGFTACEFGFFAFGFAACLN